MRLGLRDAGRAECAGKGRLCDTHYQACCIDSNDIVSIIVENACRISLAFFSC